MAAAKKERQIESQLNEKMGQPGDVDFQRMIRGFRDQNSDKKQPHAAAGETKITICVRKRPVNAKEVKKRDYDAVTCLNPMAIVHDCKLKVDGITKYLDSNAFSFDHVRVFDWLAVWLRVRGAGGLGVHGHSDARALRRGGMWD